MTLPQGWLSPQEAGELENLARDRVVLEVGAWLGLSTVTMAKVAHLVVSVDHHKGSPEHQAGQPCHDPTLVNQFGEVDTLPQFRGNLRRNDVRDRVIVVVSSFEEIGPLLAPQSFDLIFIDGAHDSGTVLTHAELADDLLAAGGQIAFHDANWPTVKAALDTWSELTRDVLGPQFSRRDVGSLAIFQVLQ